MAKEKLIQGAGDDANGNIKVYSLLKVYLGLTGQCCPFESNQANLKKIYIYRLYQFLLFGLASLYFVYSLGIWGSKEYDITLYFFYYPITTAERTIWEFRWLITCYFGIFLGSSVWLKFFKNKDITLTTDRWEKVKWFSWKMVGSLFVVWSLSVICSLSEIDFVVAKRNVRACSLDVIFTLIDRMVTFPLFLVFCVAIYILASMVEEYREKVGQWPKGDDGENRAREEFRKIKETIRLAGHLFERYLTCHFLLLFCTFFLGICSCFEQMEVRISDNTTLMLPFTVPTYSRAFNYAGNFSNENPHELTASSFTALPSLADVKTAMNGSTKNSVAEAVKTKWLKKSMQIISVSMIIKTVESLLLYLVPLGLMVWLENRLRRVVETIEDSNCREQENLGYIFSDVSKIRTMCKYAKTASGVKVFGGTVPIFQSVILAAFGPFVGVVIRCLLSHIHMKQ